MCMGLESSIGTQRNLSMAIILKKNDMPSPQRPTPVDSSLAMDGTSLLLLFMLEAFTGLTSCSSYVRNYGCCGVSCATAMPRWDTFLPINFLATSYGVPTRLWLLKPHSHHPHTHMHIAYRLLNLTPLLCYLLSPACVALPCLCLAIMAPLWCLSVFHVKCLTLSFPTNILKCSIWFLCATVGPCFFDHSS